MHINKFSTLAEKNPNSVTEVAPLTQLPSRDSFALSKGCLAVG